MFIICLKHFHSDGLHALQPCFRSDLYASLCWLQNYTADALVLSIQDWWHWWIKGNYRLYPGTKKIYIWVNKYCWINAKAKTCKKAQSIKQLMGWMTDRRQTELNGSVSRGGGGGLAEFLASTPLFLWLGGVFPVVCRQPQAVLSTSPSLCLSLSAWDQGCSELVRMCVCVCVPTLSVASIKPARADWDQGEIDRQHQLTGTQ